MKHIIVILTICAINIFTSAWLYGQNKDYYSKVEEIKTSEYTYKITCNKLVPQIKIIENAANVKFHSPWYYKNSNEIVNYETFSTSAKLENEEMLYQTIREVLSEEELDKIRVAVTDSKGSYSRISMQVVVSVSGYLLELKFYVDESKEYFLGIHPDKLYQIETRYKENLRFSMKQPKSYEILEYIRGTTVRIDFRKL